MYVLSVWGLCLLGGVWVVCMMCVRNVCVFVCVLCVCVCFLFGGKKFLYALVSGSPRCWRISTGRILATKETVPRIISTKTNLCHLTSTSPRNHRMPFFREGGFSYGSFSYLLELHSPPILPWWCWQYYRFRFPAHSPLAFHSFLPLIRHWSLWWWKPFLLTIYPLIYVLTPPNFPAWSSYLA